MLNKLLLAVIALFVLAAVATALSLFLIFDAESLLAMAVYAGMFMMFMNGTFKSARGGVGIIAVVLAALTMQSDIIVMWVPGTFFLLPFSAIFLLISYSLHFGRKTRKTTLDVLKLLTVLVVGVAIPLVEAMLGWYSAGIEFIPLLPIAYVTHKWGPIVGYSVFFLTFAVFLADLRRQRTTK
jgi:hypothetical protein